MEIEVQEDGCKKIEKESQCVRHEEEHAYGRILIF